MSCALFRAQVFTVPSILAHLGDAVWSGRERGLATRCRQQVYGERLGTIRRVLHCQLHGQPRRVHDRQGGLRQNHRH